MEYCNEWNTMHIINYQLDLCYFAMAMAGEFPLLDYVTPIFYRTEVGAHDPIFIADKFLDGKVRFLKACAHDPI